MSNDAQHVTIDELADAAESLLPADRAAAVDAHLTGCDDCRSLAAALVDVCTALENEPAPAMPDDVFSRLQSVVAAESDRRARGLAGDDDAEAAALAAKRTDLGTFGSNPAYGRKNIGGSVVGDGPTSFTL